MSAVVRRAGRVRRSNGKELVWSVADGTRGRRWRAMTTRDGHLLAAMLLEVSIEGRPTRLELAAATGLLTLHPEPPDELHGNLVTPTGVHHLAFPWSDGHELAIDRLPIAGAVTARRLASTTTVGEGRIVPVVRVTDDLDVDEGVRRFVRLTESDWRIEAGDETRMLTIDERGLPVWTVDPRRDPAAEAGETSGETDDWPLELDPQD